MAKRRLLQGQRYPSAARCGRAVPGNGGIGISRHTAQDTRMAIETEIEAHIAAVEQAYRDMITGPNARIEGARALDAVSGRGCGLAGAAIPGAGPRDYRAGE
jgi:hypothetical protein